MSGIRGAPERPQQPAELPRELLRVSGYKKSSPEQCPELSPVLLVGGGLPRTDRRPLPLFNIKFLQVYDVNQAHTLGRIFPASLIPGRSARRSGLHPACTCCPDTHKKRRPLPSVGCSAPAGCRAARRCRSRSAHSRSVSGRAGLLGFVR